MFTVKLTTPWLLNTGANEGNCEGNLCGVSPECFSRDCTDTLWLLTPVTLLLSPRIFWTSALKVLLEPVKILQVACFCSSPTFSYCHRLPIDLWPVCSWMIFSGTSCLNSSVAPDARRLWLVKFPCIFASWNIVLTILLRKCLPLGWAEYQTVLSLQHWSGLQ